jgi:hypothetical protein
LAQGLSLVLLLWVYGNASVAELEPGWFAPFNWILGFPYIFGPVAVSIPFTLFVSRSFCQATSKAVCKT